MEGEYVGNVYATLHLNRLPVLCIYICYNTTIFNTGTTSSLRKYLELIVTDKNEISLIAQRNSVLKELT